MHFATASTDPGWLRATAIEDGFVNDVMQHSRARSIVLTWGAEFVTLRDDTPQSFHTRQPIEKGDFVALSMCPTATIDTHQSATTTAASSAPCPA